MRKPKWRDGLRAIPFSRRSRAYPAPEHLVTHNSKSTPKDDAGCFETGLNRGLNARAIFPIPARENAIWQKRLVF